MQAMRTIAMINQKGGVGKTTTTANLAAALAGRGLRVAAVDLDPQSHLTMHLGVEPGSAAVSTYEVLTQEAALSAAAMQVAPNLWLIPSSIDLAGAEIELVSTVGREQILADRLAAEAAAVRLRRHRLPALAGPADAQRPGRVGRGDYPAPAALPGLARPGQAAGDRGLGTRAHQPAPAGRGRAHLHVRERHPPGRRGDRRRWRSSWPAPPSRRRLGRARMFETVIRRNVKLAECPSFGQTIFQYEPNSHGATDYDVLAEEFLALHGHAPRPPLPKSPEPPPRPSSLSLEGEGQV